VREVGMYVVGISVLWLGSEMVRVWFERRVERVFVNGAGRLRVSIARKAMMQIGRAMSRRNSAAVIVIAMALTVVVAELGNPTKIQKNTELLWISSMLVAMTWTDSAKVQTVVVNRGADSDFLRLRFLRPAEWSIFGSGTLIPSNR
jgi:hypothetical protein